MLLLGIDAGTSSIKVSVVDANTRRTLASASYPEKERDILVKQPGWAEQAPAQWWEDVKQAILKVHASQLYNPLDISAIGIAYQMHGLVVVDKDQQVLRDAIIWCDSRAVAYGNAAFETLGKDNCLTQLLNSPGNFTAAKLAWVKDNEPAIYEQIDKIMLPGDYIAMKLTGNITATIPMLSEGVFWDFKHHKISDDVLEYFGFDRAILPEIQPLFSSHGALKSTVASELGLKAGIFVTYKAGDQPNNALSLGTLAPGEVAATAGTSGVIYAVTDQLFYDKQSRVNTFAHVNHTPEAPRLGVLLCINGTGIANKWIKTIAGQTLNYPQINTAAAAIPAGSDGLLFLPFGNGAERMLSNKQVQAHFLNIDLNTHSTAHLFRSVQEGIAFSFRYGLDIMRQNGLQPTRVKAGKANMFLSDTFAQAFVQATGLSLDLYETDGSIGAALGAGIGAGIFNNPEEAFISKKSLSSVSPDHQQIHYEEIYQRWKEQLRLQLSIP